MTRPSRLGWLHVRPRLVPTAVTIALVLVAATMVAWHPWTRPAAGTEAVQVAATGSRGPATEATATPSATPTPTPTRSPDAVFTIVAAGDVLTHAPLLTSASDGAGGYNFAPLLDPVKPWIAGADLALCHLETPIVPPGQKVSGYPVFGAPAAIVPALRAQGWDGCSTASNHSMDRGMAGVSATLDALDAAGLGHAGTARNATESSQPQMYELRRAGQTIRVAQIAAAYGTNGLPIPANAPWALHLIDAQSLIAQAVAARAAGADLVVASIHCCDEYVSNPAPEQVALANALAASGQIDLIVGHHAHVPQPIVKLPGGPRGEGLWVAYGLGNFISNQDTQCCRAETNTGVLMTATIVKPPDGPARVAGVEWTAITVDRLGKHHAYAIPDVIGSPTGVGRLSHAELTAREQRVTAVVGPTAPERTTPPTPTGPEAIVVPRAAS